MAPRPTRAATGEDRRGDPTAGPAEIGAAQDPLARPARTESRARARLGGIEAAALGRFIGTAPWRWSLSDKAFAPRAPLRPAFVPEEPFPGDPRIADELFRGRYEFAGEVVLGQGESPWTLDGSRPWTEALHGFGWLRHLRASGGDTARRLARGLTTAWLNACGEHHAIGWRPEIVGRRAAAWATHADFLLDGADGTFARRLMTSLARQVAHLGLYGAAAPDGAARFAVLTGRILGSLSLGLPLRRVTRLLARLEREASRQILGDGGHASRNPSDHLAVLADLVRVRGGLVGAGLEVPVPLAHAIDRMAPMLRFWRLGDGGLALFNGSFEGDATAIERLLARSDAKGKPLGHAVHSGYQRVQAKRAVLVMDVGPPPPPGLMDRAHAGLLSFELSSGKDRLIVNCGSARADPKWSRALKATAAHSTLVLGDENACVFVERAGLGTDLDGPAPHVETLRREAEGAVWIEARHDGYAKRHGIVHERRIYIDAAGDDVRGEDALIPAGGAPVPGQTFAVRFHLHPDIRCSLSGDGVSAIFRAPSGEGWRFRAAGGLVSLEESVYLGRQGDIRRTEQLVISGTAEHGRADVKWAMRREGGKD
jgi:uncharacterized heparinase superfamily protein